MCCLFSFPFRSTIWIPHYPHSVWCNSPFRLLCSIFAWQKPKFTAVSILAWQNPPNSVYIGQFFPTCQVRVVRFYVSCLVLLLLVLLLLLLSSPPPLVVLLVLLLNCDSRSTVFSVGPQPRPSTPSVPCRTSTTTITASVPCRTSTTGIPAQCSLPDLNHDHPHPVFPAGPQPRVSPPSVPCRTSTTTIHAQCSLPDLNREYPRQKICHIECQKICQIEC